MFLRLRLTKKKRNKLHLSFTLSEIYQQRWSLQKSESRKIVKATGIVIILSDGKRKEKNKDRPWCPLMTSREVKASGTRMATLISNLARSYLVTRGDQTVGPRAEEEQLIIGPKTVHAIIGFRK